MANVTITPKTNEIQQIKKSETTHYLKDDAAREALSNVQVSLSNNYESTETILGLTSPVSGDSFQTAISKLHAGVVADELIIQAGLNDLDTRLNQKTDTTYKLTVNGTINGDSTSGTNLGTIYAPTTSGTSGQILSSNGTGAPSWVSFSQSGSLLKLDGETIYESSAPENVACISDDTIEGIIPTDGIRKEVVNASSAISINPDVVTVINGTVGTSTITLQIPDDNLAHVWDILMTTSSSIDIDVVTSVTGTIITPNGFELKPSTSCEINVIGAGSIYYLRYGEFGGSTAQDSVLGLAQADWNETDSNSPSYIKNKPSIPAAQIQSNWNETNNSSLSYIQNKPTIPTVNNATLTIQKNGTQVAQFGANANSNVTANIIVPTGDLASINKDGTSSTKYLRGDATWQTFPTSLPANGGNATTVNNHIVNEDVPSGAVFTDTTYVFNTAYNASTNKAATMADIPSVGLPVGSGIVTSLASLPVTNRMIVATISTNQSTVSISNGISALGAGCELHVVVKATTAVTITLPTSSPYVNMYSDTTFSMTTNTYAEINFISDGTNIYVRAIQ